MIGQRPRGVSANVPQAAIDELLREDPTQDHHGEIIQQPNFAPVAQSTSIAEIEKESELVEPEKQPEK